MKLKERIRHLFSRKPKLHFLHIGKTGGSAIKDALKPQVFQGHYQIYLHQHKTSLRDIPKGEKVVFFLRDPVSRFVSGFYSRQRKGLPRYHNEWSVGEAQAFEIFETANQLALALDPGHHDHQAALQAMDSIKHVGHYSEWFENPEYFDTRSDDILFIGFQETLDKDFLILLDLCGLSQKEVRLPVDAVSAHRSPASLDTKLDDNARSILEAWFKEDRQFYTYCTEFMKQGA